MANKQIIKERRLQDDAWKVVNLVDGEAAIDVCLPVGPLLVPLAVWKAKKACLIHREYEHGTPLGIWLAPEDRVEDIAADIDDFTVIAVHFPKFADGRGYSTRTLRLRRRTARLRRHRPRPDLLPQPGRLRQLRFG